MKKTELIIMAAMLGIIIMMVIPISKILLDVLIVINLFVAMTVLLVAMSTPKPVEFSVFPSLLLVTTLYRLALNISSTRLILGQADAGRVIQTFGSFVISGNVLVGLIVFVILSIIQFVVITKGADRVAEVAARFTLDAMPGKQISIDADLNSGLVTEAEARARRREIESEADFYGAMDGASKFVKGDAVATLLIAVVNIIGGFIIGMLFHGMNWQTSIRTYTMLSVGDALVSEIPALLLSTATGLIVTRGASDTNLGADVVKQIFNYPKALYTVAVVIGLLGIFTPIGPLRTLPIAAVIAILAYRVQASANLQTAVERRQEQEKVQLETKKPQSILSALRVDPIELEFGFSLIPVIGNPMEGEFGNRIAAVRKQVALELGVVVPMVSLQGNPSLDGNSYVLKLNGAKLAEGTVMPHFWLAMDDGTVKSSVVGIPTTEPTFGMPAMWIAEEMKERAESEGYTVVDTATVICTHMMQVLQKHAYELLGRQEVKELLDNVRTYAPTLVDDLVPSVMSLSQVQRVLKNLLQEGVSIRPLHMILETLSQHGETVKDTKLLTEFVRQGLSRQICGQLADAENRLAVIALSAAIEGTLEENLVNQGGSTFVGLDAGNGNEVFRKIKQESDKSRTQGRHSILLTNPRLRYPLRNWLATVLPDLYVLSYSELAPDVRLECIGTVQLEEKIG